MATFERTDPDGDIAAALAGIRNRLDTLARTPTLMMGDIY